MELSKHQQFSFFKNKQAKKLNMPTLILVGILSFGTGLSVNLATPAKPIVSISSFDNLDIKNFAVEAVSNAMSLDNNYVHTIQDNADKYFTNSGYNQYLDNISSDYKTQLDFVKLNSQNKQVAVADKYSFVNIYYKSTEGAFYTIKFKETLTINHQDVVKEKNACINIKEIRGKLKIDKFSLSDEPEKCGLSE